MKDSPEKASRENELDPESWLDRYGDEMFRYAYARLRHRTQAEDAVQECLLAALNACSKYQGKSSEKTWLFGILKHKILDQFRHNTREIQIEIEPGNDTLLERNFDSSGAWRKPPGIWQDPDSMVEHDQFWNMIERCINGLPKTLSVAIRLIEIDDVDSDEVCDSIGISKSNLWVRLHRARLGLRDCIQRSWFSQPSTGNEA